VIPNCAHRLPVQLPLEMVGWQLVRNAALMSKTLTGVLCAEKSNRGIRNTLQQFGCAGILYHQTAKGHLTARSCDHGIALNPALCTSSANIMSRSRLAAN